MSAPLHHYTANAGSDFGNSWRLSSGNEWCHDVMVEAVDHCRLLPTSIVDIYKVF
jgi:hypothetical protein